jgi:hypothetical protein
MSDTRGEEITLSASEMAFAAFSGVARESANRAHGRGRAGGFTKSGWDAHIEGACGECAVGKCLGVYWPPGMGTMKGPDLLHCIEVRTTPGHNYRLPVKRTDPEDRWFVLVTGIAPVFFVRGWIGPDEARRDEWWDDTIEYPNWMVPQSALHPIGTLLDAIHHCGKSHDMVTLQKL